MNSNIIGTKNFYDVSACLSERIRNIINNIPDNIKCCVQEIRLRIHKNIILNCPNGSYALSVDGELSEKETLFCITPTDIDETFKSICNYSLYSHQNQIRNGYITLRGGHRAGICGTAVISNGVIINIRDISSINIRIARQMYGCANDIIKLLDGNVGSTLIVGPPSSGKTTILRDISRQLSNISEGYFKKVCIVDERGEIGCSYKGIPQCDIGLCDLLDAYPKGEGILQAIRSLSPDIVVCDEVGSDDDVRSIEMSLNAGVKVIASIHAGSLEEFLNRPQAKRLLNTKAFKNIIILENRNTPGKIHDIYNAEDINV